MRNASTGLSAVPVRVIVTEPRNVWTPERQRTRQTAFDLPRFVHRTPRAVSLRFYLTANRALFVACDLLSVADCAPALETAMATTVIASATVRSDFNAGLLAFGQAPSMARYRYAGVGR